MKTRRIGEQFDFKGVKLEVVGTPKVLGLCSRCYFSDVNGGECLSDERFEIAGSCISHLRKDRKEVYFKEVRK